MANYANLLATIAANIYQNGNNEVTASMVKAACDAIVSGLGTMREALPSSDLNDVLGNGSWILTDANTYQNVPNNSRVGFLRVSAIEEGSWYLQEYYSFNGGELYKRRSNGATWEGWQRVGTGMLGVLPSSDLNDVTSVGTWLLITNNTYQNVPGNSSSGWLRVSDAGNYVLQEFIGFNGTVLYARRITVGDSISAWTKLNGDTYNITNNYSVSPTITTDTNNYLAASGDTSDRAAEIVSMLQTTGICRLGPGDFYVSGIQMPEDTSIIGCGNSTIVHLITSVTDGFAIKANSHCLIKDLCLQGRSSYNPSSTIGTRHGILFEGDFTQSQTAPLPCMISDVRIYNFEGGGITCYDTGTGTYDFVNAMSVHIENCGVGINVSYFSEYHKFTNVRAWGCYYGCINNGGNNVFVNCDFSRSIGKAFVMDNSQGQSPNNSHGSCVGCLFNHAADNTGIGIEIRSCKNGFIFSGCQIFYSKMNLVDADGIVVQGCNFGTEEIILDWCGSVVFANNVFGAAPTVTKLRQSNIFASNNYVRSTGAAVTF